MRMNDGPSQNHQSSGISDSKLTRPNLNGASLFKLGAVVAGSVILTVVILAFFLIALEGRDKYRRQMKQTTQVRGIVQGLYTYAGGNKEKMPGLNSRGYLVRDVDGAHQALMPTTKHGGTVEGRFWIMLDANAFYGEYLISPSETKAAWTTGEVSADNYSYALLNIHSDGGPIADDETRPDQVGRAREWKQSINTQAVLITDRARILGGRIGNDYDKIYSIRTSEDSGRWAGSVGRGDGSAAFENESALDTKYGAGPTIEYDRLFSRHQDPGAQADILNVPGDTWDDESNALLGYTSVGYEDDDIASE